MNLIVESNIHHQHLPSDADPARAAGVVGVHAASEPHLETHTVAGQTHHEQQQLCFSSSLTHLIILRDHPDHTNTDRHMERFHFGSWRLDLDPRRAWKKTENIDCHPSNNPNKKKKMLNEHDAGGLQTSWTIQAEASTDQ